MGIRTAVVLLACIAATTLAISSAGADARGRMHCGRPEVLRLVRFEDGSAQLRCGRRLLVRVSVPG